MAIDHGEIHEDRWLAPSAALDKHRAGEIELAPPTWITLTQLTEHASVDGALDWAASTEAEEFRTRPIGRDPVTICWAGDAGYETGDAATEGGRHRLVMETGGWVYQRNAA